MNLFTFVSSSACLAVAVAAIPQEVCKNIEYKFKTTELQYLVQVRGVEITYATWCVWIATDENGEFSGTVGSYVGNGVLDMVLFEGIPGGYRVGIHSHVSDTQLPLPANSEHLFCATLSLPENYVKLYLNGTARRTLDFTETPLDPFPSGAFLVLGQRQGCEGGCFDTTRSFKGLMRSPIIWGRVLSDAELRDVHLGICPTDYAFNYSPATLMPHGRLFPYRACPKSEHIFSNTDGSAEYVTFRKTIPALQSLTICNRITTDSNGMIPGTIGSIATEDSVDRVVATGQMVEGTPSVRLYVDGKVILVPMPIPGNMEHHICIALSPHFNKILVSVNGLRVLELLLRNQGPISKGSKLIVGQRQGCVGGCFVSQDAFVGKVNDFMIWDRVLSAAEMKAMALSDECPIDQVVDLTKDNVFVRKL